MTKVLLAAFAAVVCCALPARAADTALFDDLGGQAGIDKIVDASVDTYLADDRIKDKFADSNIDRLKGMLVDYFTMISGGPDEYKGSRNMRVIHKGLHLRNRDFTALVEDLQTGMDEADVPFPTQNRLLARLAPMRPEVVSR